MIFQGESGPPVPPLWIRTWLQSILVSQSAKWCDHLLHLSLFSCNFVVCFQSSPPIKLFLELTAWLLPGGSDFFQGGPLLIPYRNPYNLWFSRGSPYPLSPHLDPHLVAIYFSFPVRKMMRSPLAPKLVFLQLRCMFSVEPPNKIVSWAYCMTVAWFIQHLLQFVFAFFNHS